MNAQREQYLATRGREGYFGPSWNEVQNLDAAIKKAIKQYEKALKVKNTQ